ncbi:DUF4132 domain-containing protein [Thermopolyspora sp. NPDC052614]|uniref:DUF4132 domain-containing protein n=1 Tax=Thermopolyspora sp. NPDC052614 TaxID=3155682 RepID=UPI003417884C
MAEAPASASRRGARIGGAIAERGLAHLRGEANPLGAAVVAKIAGAPYHRHEAGERMVSGWAAEHGLGFAVCAYAELAAIGLAMGDRGRLAGVVQASASTYYVPWWMREETARPFRVGVATAGEGEYQEIVERLAGCRRTPEQRMVVSYLVPGRLDWVEECCADPVERGLDWMLWCALGSARHVELLDGRLTLGAGTCSPGVLATLAEGVGAAAVPELVRALGQGRVGGDARRAVLDVLAELPGDEAFRVLLDRVAERFVQPALQRAMRRFPVRALRLVAPVAGGTSRNAGVVGGLGLTPEQLADRLVPDFGLDAGGGMVLDYGPRRFVVGFDEQLKPYVADEDGKRRASLPEPGVKDDPELAPEAYKRFATLKKDVRTAAADQIRRLEAAMVSGRRWSTSEFAEFFVAHPLLWHITRRLVWTAEHDGVSTAFRVAEDRTYADVEDDVLTLPESARIGIAHPVTLGERLAAWSRLFADYEIMQPFPQLGRAVHALDEKERASGRLERFEGLKVPVGRVLGLERRGWERGTPQDAGVQGWISRQVAADRHVVIDLDPGIAIGAVDLKPEQTLMYVRLGDRPADYWPSHGTDRTFGELDPVIASEVLADLTELTASNS